MLALGLNLGITLSSVPAIGGNGLPPLPHGWAFLTLDGVYVLFEGSYLVVEAN